MKVLILGKWHPQENYDLFLLTQKLFEESGYEVVKQQDYLPQEKGQEVSYKESDIIERADMVIRIYRGDAQSDEASYEGTMAVMKSHKPLVTLVAPGFTKNDLPSCLLTYSKEIIELEKMDQIKTIKLEELL